MSKRYKRFMSIHNNSSHRSQNQDQSSLNADQFYPVYANKKNKVNIQDHSEYIPQITAVLKHRLDRVKSKQQTIKQIALIDQQLREKEGIEQIPHIQIVDNSQYVNNKRQEKLLQKQYPNHSYLPLDYLRDIKKILNNFQVSSQCKFQRNGQGQEYNRIRQEQRLKLTKCIIFSIFQILTKVSSFDMKEIQQSFSSSAFNKLQFGYETSRKIESVFFQKLFRKSTQRKLKEPYREQISVIVRQFSDKNNLQFRRKIINNEYNLSKLAQTKQDHLQSDKSKKEKFQQLSQLVRQNEKIQKSHEKIEEQVCFQKPIEDQFPVSFTSLKSISEHSQKDNLQEKKRREKEDLIRKNKLICKKAYSSILKTFRDMSNTINTLKSSNIPSRHLLKLKNILEK